jgi:hypothetical protein
VAHEWLKRCGKVIVYGGAEAVRGMRQRTPVTIPILEYGPRVGAVVLGVETTDTELAGLARDACAYDQAGCVSPRLVYLLGGTEGRKHGTAGSTGASPHPLVKRLATALGVEVARLDSVFTTADEAIDIRGARARIQFEADEGARALGPADLGWTILYRPETGSYSEPLPRVLWVYEAQSVAELGRVRQALEGRLQALGMAGVSEADRRGLEDLAVELGVSRVTPLGAMAWPPADWRHDGRMQLMPLLRWTDFE